MGRAATVCWRLRAQVCRKHYRMLPSPKMAISIYTLDPCNLIFTCEDAWSYLQMSCQTCSRTDPWRSAAPVLHPGQVPTQPEDSEQEEGQKHSPRGVTRVGTRCEREQSRGDGIGAEEQQLASYFPPLWQGYSVVLRTVIPSLALS